ncbi:hypothetical protein B3C1_16887 [Gallaecimonas xiamenensis 3-C-1]|uniref:Uncharacterized protein n=2 Tax=Gallaecimonas TaxID=745410 RepID=K2J109_9GAMM|nr:hypothetical protein B3C1_16887 [Gallaecimonas xiamenensis 3-C-1]
MKEYLTWEYDDYYENGVNQGKKGFNRYQRERVLDFFQRKYGYGHEKIDFSQEMKEHLDGLLKTVPQESDYHHYKGVDNTWVYFFLKKEMNFPASHYCFRLDDYNILDFVFTYMSDEYALDEKILDVRHDLEKRIMDTVSITSGVMLTN